MKKTSIRSFLGINYPVIQGGMAWASNYVLTSAEEIRDAYGPDRGRRGCQDGDWEEGYFNCGQGAALIDDVLPVDVISKMLIKDYSQAVKDLT